MIERDILTQLISIMMDGGADYCDVYAEESAYNGVTSDDRKLNTSRSSQSGVGLRIIKHHNTFYTVCQDTSSENLIAAAKHLVSGIGTAPVSPREPVVLEYGQKSDPMSEGNDDPEAVDIKLKFDTMHEAQDKAWSYSDEVHQVTARYSDFYREITIATSDTDRIIRQKLGLVEFLIAVYVGNGSDRQMGWAGKSFYKGFDALTGENSPVALAETACRQAHIMLEADDCPRGEVPVVFAPGENGILFHESCGHGMEADLVEKGSAFASMMGESVASEKVTIHDSGLLPGYPGSYAYDDEGVAAQDTVLVENGRLKNFLHSRTTAARLGASPTGSGRRQNFKFPPLPRMRNTYISAGQDDPEEIIRSTKKGIYAADVGFGGQVDVVTGRFITSIVLGYLIENGRLTRPVKGATITGIGIDALRNIDMVGNDLVINHSPGRCGKGQEVPVGVGMPTVRVRKLTVGGTGNAF